MMHTEITKYINDRPGQSSNQTCHDLHATMLCDLCGMTTGIFIMYFALL